VSPSVLVHRSNLGLIEDSDDWILTVPVIDSAGTWSSLAQINELSMSELILCIEPNLVRDVHIQPRADGPHLSPQDQAA